MFAKLAISVLAILATSTSAAPTPGLPGIGGIGGLGGGALGGLGGAGGALGGLTGVAGGNAVANGAIKVDADLKVFADAFLKVTTGGRQATCDTVNLGLGAVTSITAIAKAQVFATIAQGHCVATYSDVTACSELTAYLSATYYAYISGWTGVDLFAALGDARCGRWLSLLNGLCAAKACPTGLCTGIIGQFNALVHTSVDVNVKANVNVVATIKSTLQSCGLLTLIDACAVLKVNANGFIHIGARNLPIATIDFTSRGLLGSVPVVGAVAGGQGSAAGSGVAGLGLGDDLLDLGLAGKGSAQGKGFLGAIIA